MAAMKPRTGDGPLEATAEGRGIVVRIPTEGGRSPRYRDESAGSRQTGRGADCGNLNKHNCGGTGRACPTAFVSPFGACDVSSRVASGVRSPRCLWCPAVAGPAIRGLGPLFRT